MKYLIVFLLVDLDRYYCHRYGNPQSFYLQLLPSFNLPAITANIYSFLYTNQKVWVQVRNAAQAWSIACAYEEEIKQPKDVVIEVFNIPFIRNKRYQWQYCAAEFSLIWLLVKAAIQRFRSKLSGQAVSTLEFSVTTYLGSKDPANISEVRV